MPKQPARVHAAKSITVQDPVNHMHCRALGQVLQDAGDKARLRGTRDRNTLVLQVQPHRDPLIRRVFSRGEIGMERLAMRSALAQAALNVTPERLKKLGSPGLRAVRTLQAASSVALDRDVRAGQVRSAVALLAGTGKKRSFNDGPSKPRSSWLAQAGANTLTSRDGTRRVQLRKFCIDKADVGKLAALLAQAGDESMSIAASISIFRAAALSFIVEDMKGGKRRPEAVAAQIRSRCDSVLLRLFIRRWRQAAAQGTIGKGAWVWFDAVDWLAAALHGARPTGPGATRAPKSPRAVSPAAAPPGRKQTAAPTPIPTGRPLRRRVATPAKAAEARRRLPLARAVPLPGLPRQGRQSASLRMLNQPFSPTRLAEAPPARQERTVSRIAGTPPGASSRPARSAPIGQAKRLALTATLLDILLDYSRNQNAAASGGSEAGSQVSYSHGGDASTGQ